MNRLILALIFVSVSANASTFEERVNKANAAFETEQGEAYEKMLGPYIHASIKKCAPPGSNTKENLGKFVLVADVSAEGKIYNVIVRPETKASICFSREFGLQIFPTPPESLISDGFTPLVVEIYIVP